MRLAMALSTALALSACAPQIIANEAGGIIDNATGTNTAQAFALADQHCRQYMKRARIRETTTEVAQMTFDCVNP